MPKIYILNGPEQGKSFELDKDIISVGRARENDIQILDKTVSRRHLEIVRRENRYFARDLESLNGTFLDGRYIRPGEEVEIREGSPVVLGMSVICLGKGCIEHVMPFLDSIELTKDLGEESGLAIQQRSKTNQKIMELIYSVSRILDETTTTSIKRALAELLESIFQILKRIDRAAILLMDPKTGKVIETLSRSREESGKSVEPYCREVVKRVIEEGRAVFVADTQKLEGDEIVDTLKVSRVASVMCVPIMSGSQVRGAVYVDSLSTPYSFRKRDLSLFMDLGRRAGIALEGALLKESLERG
ncbi:MAG: FHA domain-containing protein [Deltaproteobacteria bacterium]|nr:FHA domain-containing protein [Deltaproteobacteria bacterium]